MAATLIRTPAVTIRREASGIGSTETVAVVIDDRGRRVAHLYPGATSLALDPWTQLTLNPLGDYAVDAALADDGDKSADIAAAILAAHGLDLDTIRAIDAAPVPDRNA